MEHLKKIERILQKYTKSYHFYLRDLRSNAEFELGEKKRYPICSCFKLAVLMAFFDSLESEEQLFEEVVIEPKDFSPGGGIIIFGTRTYIGTPFSLCQMMMSFSDGTATDYLVNRVGLERINYFLSQKRELSKVSTNLKDMVLNFQKKYPMVDIRSDKKINFEFDDVTNAQELESLAFDAFCFQPKKIPRRLYLETLGVKRLLERTSLYFGEGVKTFGKTGSIGYAYFANDSGVVVVEKEPVASFGIATEGFVVEKDVVEIIFGIVGLYMLEHLGVGLKPNVRYSKYTRAMVED